MENLDHINKKDDEMRHILHTTLEGNDAWAQPGEQVWDGIEASLPPQKRRGGFWWWLGGLSALALIILFSQQKWSGPEIIQDASVSQSLGVPSTTEQIKSSSTADSPEEDQQISSLYEPEIAKTQFNSEAQTTGPEETINVEKRDIKWGENKSPAVPPSIDAGPIPEIEKEIILPIPESPMEEELRADLSTPELNPIVQLFSGLELPFQEVHSESFIDVLSLAHLIAIQQPLLASQINSKQNIHRVLVYGQGLGADRQITRKSNINLFDPEFGHNNWQYRIGAGYEWQHKSGFFIGSGLEYQDFHEQVDKEKSWTYTKKNATQVGTDVYEQNIPVVINTGFGTTTTTLRVDIEESSIATDYQEGDNVSFRLTVDHSLKWLRVPMYAGYHYEWRNWFAEIRAGMGLQVFLASKASITEVLESRGKIKIRESETSKQLKHLRSTIWDAQGGLYAGYRFSDSWSASIGYEQWYSLQSVVDRPNVSTKTNGSGVQLALRRQF